MMISLNGVSADINEEKDDLFVSLKNNNVAPNWYLTKQMGDMRLYQDLSRTISDNIKMTIQMSLKMQIKDQEISQQILLSCPNQKVYIKENSRIVSYAMPEDEKELCQSQFGTARLNDASKNYENKIDTFRG